MGPLRPIQALPSGNLLGWQVGDVAFEGCHCLLCLGWVFLPSSLKVGRKGGRLKRR